MPDYVCLMHDDSTAPPDQITGRAWGAYIAGLQKEGHFQGGSALGGGICVRKSGRPPAITAHITGFIRMSADGLDHARILLAGNPVFQAGGTVEIRELPRTG